MASDINWPGPPGLILPLPLRKGYGYAPRTPTISRTFGVATVTRRIYSDAPADFASIGFLLTPDQQAIVEAFWWHELDAGTRYFLLPLLVAGRAVEPVECSFLGQPLQTALVGAAHYNATAQLTTRAGTQMSAAAWALLNE